MYIPDLLDNLKRITVQYHSKNTMTDQGNDKRHPTGTNSPDEGTLQNHPVKKAVTPHFGRANNDADNIRRQKQDYFDKWQHAHPSK